MRAHTHTRTHTCASTHTRVHTQADTHTKVNAHIPTTEGGGETERGGDAQPKIQAVLKEKKAYRQTTAPTPTPTKKIAQPLADQQ